MCWKKRRPCVQILITERWGGRRVGQIEIGVETGHLRREGKRGWSGGGVSLQQTVRKKNGGGGVAAIGDRRSASATAEGKIRDVTGAAAA